MVEWQEGLVRRVPKTHKQIGQSSDRDVLVSTIRHSHRCGWAVTSTIHAERQTAAVQILVTGRIH